MVDQGPPVDAQCPSWAASLGYMGVAAAVCLSNWGSAVSIKRHNPIFTIFEIHDR
jgi:negative regulator of sigma E activity